MTTRTAFLIVVTSVILLGCVSVPPPGGGPRMMRAADCHGASCNVDVWVVPDWFACKISVDPELLYVHGRGKVSVIHWDLKTSGYTFPSDGIVVDDDTARDFSCKVDNPRKFVCQNKHTVAKAYKYTVKVTGTCHTPPLDPYVVND